MLCIQSYFMWCALFSHHRSFLRCSNIRCDRSSLKIIHLNPTEQKTRNAFKTQSLTLTLTHWHWTRVRKPLKLNSFTIQHSTNESCLNYFDTSFSKNVVLQFPFHSSKTESHLFRAGNCCLSVAPSPQSFSAEYNSLPANMRFISKFRVRTHFFTFNVGTEFQYIVFHLISRRVKHSSIC